MKYISIDLEGGVKEGSKQSNFWDEQHHFEDG